MTQNFDFSSEQGDIIESIRETDGIPGVAAAIVKDGEIIAAGGFGYRNRDAELPMTAHTVFFADFFDIHRNCEYN